MSHCVCVCVRERERKGERERQREREREREQEREPEREPERERESERESERARERESERAREQESERARERESERAREIVDLFDEECLTKLLLLKPRTYKYKDNEKGNHSVVGLAVPLNVEHELTRQRKWDKQETQEYMRHFDALKLDKLTSDPR